MSQVTSPSLSTLPGWQTLAPNLAVLLRPDTSNDIVALIAFMPIGASAESRADAGIVSLTGRMLLRGTRRLTYAELADAIDGMGISLSCDASDDYTNAHVITTRDTLAESIALFSETLFEPAFEPEELEKERQTTLAAIRRSEDDLLSTTLKNFYSELYPTHGYGLPTSGLKESVGELTREQVISTHEELTTSPIRIVAVGNFTPDEINALLLQHFVPRMRPAVDAASLITPATPIPADPHTISFTRESEQAYLVMGFPALKPTDPAYAASRVLNALLGEGMSSRLFSALREEKGLAYATGSSYSAMKHAGQLFGYIGTKPESLDMAQEGMLAEFQRIKTQPIPEDELLRAKNYLIGKFLIDHQKNFRRAFYLGHFDQMGLGWQMDDLYPGLIASVTAEKVQQTANQILTTPTTIRLTPNKP